MGLHQQSELSSEAPVTQKGPGCLKGILLFVVLPAALLIGGIVLMTMANPDHHAWKDAVDNDTVGSYKYYLKKLPDGPHAQEARTRIKRVEKMKALQAQLSPSDLFSENKTPPDGETKALSFTGPYLIFPVGGKPRSDASLIGILTLVAVDVKTNQVGRYTIKGTGEDAGAAVEINTRYCFIDIADLSRRRHL